MLRPDTSAPVVVKHQSPIMSHQRCQEFRVDLLAKVLLLLGTSGELPGKSGELLGNLWIALEIHSARSSGQVAGELLGKLGEILGRLGSFQKLWKSDSLLVTRQNCLHFSFRPTLSICKGYFDLKSDFFLSSGYFQKSSKNTFHQEASEHGFVYGSKL